MKLEHRYKYECDSLLLLVDEFEKTSKRYENENENEASILSITAYDMNEYQAPKYISNYKTLLTSFLLIEIQALLDFILPIIVKNLATSKDIPISPFDKTWKNGNVLCWTKHVIKDEIKSGYDFGCAPFSELQKFYKIRNDQIHSGGYLSDERQRDIINRLEGVYTCQYTDLYVIDFLYCRNVISNVESFFHGIHESISNK